jgi:hypothetical protein
MKKLTFIILVVILSGFVPRELLTGFKPGAYRLTLQSFTSITDGQAADSSKVRQLKIYTGHYVMYANVNSTDSSSSFGIGTYTQTKSGVREAMVYSGSSHSSDDTLRYYDLKISEKPKGYQQVIQNIGPDNKYTLKEDYTTVSTNDVSPLDGAWKQTNNYWIKGKDNATNKNIQFKMYFAGHFIWGQSGMDSSGIKQTGIGFGSFKMNGKNKLTEKVAFSTYSEINGREFKIDLLLKDHDTYRQTTNHSDGTVQIEEYKRLR